MNFRFNNTSFLLLRNVMFLFLLGIFWQQSNAQQKIVKFENYSKDHGLLHSYVLAIFQDSEGFIWVGSYGGVNRFDGADFMSYSNRTTIKTPVNVTYDILEPTNEKGKTLWFGTDDGLMKLDKPTMTFTHYPYKSADVLAIEEDQNGKLWLGTEHMGLLKFDPTTKTFSTTSLTKTAKDDWGHKIKTIHKDNLGNLWIGGSKTGVIKFNASNDTFERFLNPIPGSNSINCFYKYQNKLMLGTAGAGMFLFDNNTTAFNALKNEQANETPIFPVITGIAPDHEGDLWISTLGGGLYETKIQDHPNTVSTITNVQQYTKSSCGINSISNNILQLLYKDHTGNLWIGSLGGGLSKLDFYSHKFDHYRIQESLSSNLDGGSVLSVGKNADGHLWYGTQSDGIYIYSSKQKLLDHIPLKALDGSNCVVRQIYCDYKNRMWIGVDGGIFLISADGKKKLYFDLAKHGLAYGSIHAIGIDHHDNLWFGVYEYGIYRVPLPQDPFSLKGELNLSNHYKNAYSKGNLSSNLIWAIHIDKENQIWVGTDKGLDLYDVRRDSFIKTLDKNVSCIMESDKVNSNSMWVGTYGSGLYLMNKTDYNTFNFSTENGLSNNNINGILEDANGNIWAGTEKGVCSIDPSGLYNTDLSKISDKHIGRVHCYYFQDGLQGHEFHLNANEQLKDGRLLFGGPNGFNIFNPHNIIENTFVFPAKIQDIKIHNRSVKEDTSFKQSPEYLENLSLKFKDNYLTIEFSQVCLSNQEHASYQYMLEGYDKDWITIKALHRRITYTGIPEGDYCMKIKAINPDGYPSDQITKLNIHIDPPWYRALWFLIIAFIVFVIAIILIYKAISKRNKVQHLADLSVQQEAFEKEKLKVDLEYKTKELSSSAMYLLNRNEKLTEIKDMAETTIRKAGDKGTAELSKIVAKIDDILKDKDNWDSFEKNFNLIDSNFTKRLMDAYPALSNNDVKICTYMRMNLDSKEIAGLLNIAPKSLETSRLRIRKKMELDSAVYLSDFILKF